MTPRERLLTVLNGKIPDCVPVAPDFSNMIPARLTGKPFWDLYLYNDPPIWEAYIAAAKHFNIDSLMDGYFWLSFPDEQNRLPWERLPTTPEQQKQIVPASQWQRFIVSKNSERIVVQRSYIENRKRVWEPRVCVYYVADSPIDWIPPSIISLPDIPSHFEPLENVKPVDNGPAGLARTKQLLGDQGLVGVFLASSAILSGEQDIYDYYDHPGLHGYWRDMLVERVEKRFANIMTMPVKPDFICVGGSGTLVFQTVDIFRQLAFPAVKRAIDLASKAGIPTHIHSCGPEKALIKIMAEETMLTVIDPLEIPPMGDCVLTDMKKLYGNKLVLKGNLHTTDVMLFGSPDDVIAASKKAIDDAAEGGRFILSTGDQCGRDTPDANLLAMVDTARTYGKY
ncbi:MAG: uroporphyrinogen decarboxylase family protein [Sedimentisphaerales bacterium]|jgi:uroporphyrinogen decarboxylase